MERSSRSLRKLPVRLSSDRSKSRRPAEDKDAIRKSPPKKSPRVVRRNQKSPVRRSRSRSAGRRKPIQKAVEEKEEAVISANSVKTKSVSPSKSSVISRIRESVENVRNSLSPEVEEVVRRSVSRFEEVKAEVVRNMLPRASSLTVTTRSSTLRQRTAENSVVTSIESDEEGVEIYEEEKMYRNHVGLKREEHREPLIPDKGREKGKILQTLLYLILGAIMCLLTLASRVICTKNDCRLLLPSPEKVLNYKLFYDAYVWIVFSATWLLLFIASHFYHTRLKKKMFFSPLGMTFLSVTAGAVGVCHYHYNGVKDVNPLPILAATIFHMVILLAVAGNSPYLLGVKLDLFVSRISSILMVILVSNIVAIEKNRTVASLPVYIAAYSTSLMAFDSMIIEPHPKRVGETPLCLLFTALKPFVFTLPLVYISANKISMNEWLLGGAFVLNFISFCFYRICDLLKYLHLYEPSYSEGNIKNSAYGYYIGGPWRRVRHVDLLGELLCELTCALTTYPCPISWFLPLLSVTSTFHKAMILDQHAPSGYLRTVKHSLVPYVY